MGTLLLFNDRENWVRKPLDKDESGNLFPTNRYNFESIELETQDVRLIIAPMELGLKKYPVCNTQGVFSISPIQDYAVESPTSSLASAEIAMV